MLRTTLALFAALLLAAPLAAQTADPLDKPVTLIHDEGLPLTDLFLELFGAARVRYALTPEAKRIAQDAEVHVKMENVPLRRVVEMLARSAGEHDGKRLSARFEEGRCIIDVVASMKPALSPSPGPGRVMVTYTGEEVSALVALTSLLDKAHAGYRIQPKLRTLLDAKTVTVKVENTPLDQAAGLLFSQLEFGGDELLRHFDAERGYYVFVLVPHAAQPRDLSGIMVAAEAKDAPLAAALEKLFAAADVSYAYPPAALGSTKVTLSMGSRPLMQGANLALKSAGMQDALRVSAAGGVMSVGPVQRRAPDATLKEPVTAHFRDTDLRYALKALFSAAGADYTLGPLVMGTVTADLKEVSLRQALEKLLQSARSPLGPIYRVEDGIVAVSVRAEYEGWK